MTMELVKLAGAEEEQDDRAPGAGLVDDTDAFEPAPEPPPDPFRFDEAVKAFRARVPMTDEAFKAIGEELHARALTVAGVTHLDVVADVWAAVDKAVAKGTTFAEFKKEVREKLVREWGAEKPGRLENIFRTNVQRAYGAGSVQQLQAPAVLRRRPFWRLSVILDGRTSPICSSLANLTLPASDPSWFGRKPPLHFKCRSKLIPLTAAQAAAMGVTTDVPETTAQNGFGEPSAPWEPDLSKYPPDLVAVYQEKLKKAS